MPNFFAGYRVGTRVLRSVVSGLPFDVSFGLAGLLELILIDGRGCDQDQPRAVCEYLGVPQDVFEIVGIDVYGDTLFPWAFEKASVVGSKENGLSQKHKQQSMGISVTAVYHKINLGLGRLWHELAEHDLRLRSVITLQPRSPNTLYDTKLPKCLPKILD